jgi:hypothetical protein
MALLDLIHCFIYNNKALTLCKGTFPVLLIEQMGFAKGICKKIKYTIFDTA